MTGLTTAAGDVREILFKHMASRSVRFRVTSRSAGLFAGSGRLLSRASDLGLQVHRSAVDGEAVVCGSAVLDAAGTPLQVAAAEESFIGLIAKPCGIATAAARAVQSAGSMKVVCGAWKKAPPELKEVVRHAIRTGGAAPRISDEPFVYLDKNFVRMLGGAGNAVRAASSLDGRLIVVQIRGELAAVDAEALEAASLGAGVLMVDTGDTADLVRVRDTLLGNGLRHRVRLAFGGGIKIEHLPYLSDMGIDIVDIGTEIVDAPMLDFRLDVVV
ncbi:MAG: nicotinate-nucleotide pyrophosphorylase [Ignavibacteriales bacterium]